MDNANKQNNGGETISEEELTKSLQKLEGKAEEAGEAKKEPPTVAVGGLAKSAKQAIDENGSEELKKSLDVSSVFGEAVAIIGAHVDSSLETLQKSINHSAQRDLAILGAFESLQNQVTELKKSIDEFGKNPAGAAKATTAADGTVKVLEKSATGANGQGGEGGEGGAATGTPSRKDVLAVMETLAKSATPGSADQKRWIDAAIKFESTGQASNADLLAVNKELKKSA